METNGMTPPIFDTDILGNPYVPVADGELSRKFIMPPFSVLSAREGSWQSRKKQWLRLGIQSELGRSAKTFNIGMNATAENGWSTVDNLGSGTSIFDPVLCELLVNWFSCPGSQIIDPFAGGSVRGIVSACLNRRYWGCDLSRTQITANKSQIGIIPSGCPIPKWKCGDSLDELDGAPDGDLILTCPPYFDLEVYSDDPRDISNMDWGGFRTTYHDIIGRAVDRLRPNRFAVVVVGDIRDDSGNYRNLPSATIESFSDAGCQLYNKCVLVTSVGSLPIRTERQFDNSRKVGMTHQEILIFVKGDGVLATDHASGLSHRERTEQYQRTRDERKSKLAEWGTT